MLRWMFPLVVILGITSCIMMVPAKVAASIDRTIDAPRTKVFAALSEERNFYPLKKVSDMGTTILYEGPIGSELVKSSDDPDSFGATFAGGKISVKVEPSSRLVYKLQSRDENTTLKLNLTFADNPDKTKTVVASHIDLQSRTMDEAERKKMETMMNVMGALQMGKLLDGIERTV